MPKTLYRPENALLCRQLRQARQDQGLTQADLSRSLGRAQTFVSDVERGVRRLDTVELWEMCRALGLDLTEFVARFQASVEQLEGKKVKRARSTGVPRSRG